MERYEVETYKNHEIHILTDTTEVARKGYGQFSIRIEVGGMVNIQTKIYKYVDDEAECDNIKTDIIKSVKELLDKFSSHTEEA